jgi:hypothetical protein
MNRRLKRIRARHRKKGKIKRLPDTGKMIREPEEERPREISGGALETNRRRH